MCRVGMVIHESYTLVMNSHQLYPVLDCSRQGGAGQDHS